MAAFLGDTLDFHVDNYYRHEFEQLRADMGIGFEFDEQVVRAIVTTVVLSPLLFQDTCESLKNRFGKRSIPLENDGYLFIDELGRGTLALYAVLPFSVMGLGEPEERPAKRARSRRRTKSRNKKQERSSSAPRSEAQRAETVAAKTALMQEHVARGRFEEAARLRDEINLLQNPAVGDASPQE